MAARTFAEENDARFVKAFAGTDRNEMGEGVHGKYHQWARGRADRSWVVARRRRQSA